jgi:hypothetical protein
MKKKLGNTSQMTFCNIHNRTQLAYTGKDDDDDNDETI